MEPLPRVLDMLLYFKTILPISGKPMIFSFVISMYIIIMNNIKFIVGLGRINKTASIQ